MTADRRCGTVAGYHAHRRRSEATCQLCRDAMNAYSKARQAERRALVRVALAEYRDKRGNGRVSIATAEGGISKHAPHSPSIDGNAC